MAPPVGLGTSGKGAGLSMTPPPLPHCMGSFLEVEPNSEDGRLHGAAGAAHQTSARREGPGLRMEGPGPDHNHPHNNEHRLAPAVCTMGLGARMNLEFVLSVQTCVLLQDCSHHSQ